MSPPLRLEFLGGFRAYVHGVPLTFPTRKSEGLLAYLAHPAGRLHPRDTLASLLWGDTPETQARQSLRQALGTIRRILLSAQDEIVVVQGDSVGLNPAAVSIDTAELGTAVAGGTLEDLARAAALYKGDFLAGLRIDERPFEDWRAAERERLHELALEAFARLLREHSRAGRADAAIQAALSILAIDPLQEPVHRALMRLLLAQRRRGAALQQYQACVTVLRQELGAEPEAETRELYREILQAGGPPSAPDLRAPGHRWMRPVETPMVGRETELARLRAIFPRVLDDGGCVTVVRGDAGIGKTRLVEETLRSDAAAHARLLLGRCYETERSLPLRPWIDALRGEPAILTAARDKLGAPTQTRLASILPELSVSPGTRQTGDPQPAMLFDPLMELFGVVASEKPLVLVLEDFHWADTMSAQFLAFMGRRIGRCPILVLATVRADELADAHALTGALKELRDEGRLEEIALGALSPEQTEMLVRALRRLERHETALADAIWRLSEGNPLVIVESTRAGDGDVPTQSIRGGRVGPAVHDLVSARLDRLDERAQQCAAVAAAIGRTFSFVLLARATGLPDADAADAVEALVRHRILDSVGDQLDFCHEWIRAVTYERVSAPRRAILHGAIGRALEAVHADDFDDIADELGTHYVKAKAFARAIPYLTRFGVLAAARYAFDDALRAFGQARAAVDQLPSPERDRCGLEVVLQEAFVLSVLGRQRELLDLLRRHTGATTRANDVALLSEYYFRLGLTHFFLGDRVEAGVAADTALAYAERLHDSTRIAKALHVLSLLAYELGQPRVGVGHAQRGIDLLDDPAGTRGLTAGWLGLLYQDLALNHMQAGEFGQALAAVERLEAIGAGMHFARLRAFAGYVSAWIAAVRGDTARAIDIARASLDIARDPMTKGLLSLALGTAHIDREPAAAMTLLTQVIEDFTTHPYRHGHVKAVALLAEARLATGDVAGARETARRALDLALADGTPFNTGLAQRVLGRVAQADGDLAEAERWLTDALATFSEPGAAFEVALTRAMLAIVLAQRGAVGPGTEHLKLALAALEGADAPRRAAAAAAQARAAGLVL